jgi:hypothetical protein
MLKVTEETKQQIEHIESVCKDSRSAYALDWKQNLRRLPAFLEDDVSPARSAGGEALAADFPTGATYPEAKYISYVNLSESRRQRLIARILNIIKELQVIAASNDEDDLLASKAAEQLLKGYLAEHTGLFFSEIVRLVTLTYACGVAYAVIEPTWEPVKIDGELTYQPDDVSLRVILADQVFHYPGIHDIHDSPAVVIHEYLTVRDLSRFLKRSIDEIPEDAPPAHWSDETGVETLEGKIEEARYLVKRLCILPCESYPRGAQRFVLGSSEWSIKDEKGEETLGTVDGRYPIEALMDVPRGIAYYTRGRMADTGPVQRALDIFWSKHLEVVRDGPNAVFWIPKGSRVSKDKITNEAIVVAEYQPVGPHMPRMDTMPEPTPLLRGIEMCEHFLDELSAQHAPSRGVAQGGRQPAKAIEMLVSQDEISDTPMAEMFKGGMARIGKRILMVGQKVWGPKKVFLVLGANRKYEAGEFRKANLKEGWDVRIAPGDSLPKSKSQRVFLVLQALQAGLLGPPETPEAAQAARKLLNVVTDDDFYAQDQVQIQRARDHVAEIRRAAEMAALGLPGDSIPADPDFDDHSVHKNVERKLVAAEMSKGTASPEFVEMMRQHVQGHDFYQQQQDQAAMPPQMQATGPAATPAPSQEMPEPVPAGV